MLKKYLFLTSLVCFAAASHAQVTVIGEALSPNLVLSSSGTDLAAGDLVEVGYFNVSSGTSVLASQSLSTLDSIFIPIGQGTNDGDTLNESNDSSSDSLEINNFESQGGFYGEFDNVDSSFTVNGTTITSGTSLYMWVFNSPSASTATQWGIFGDASWVFPPNLSQVSLSLSSAGVTVYQGAKSGSDFETAPVGAVPEPSSLAAIGAIILCGGAAALRRRRA